GFRHPHCIADLTMIENRLVAKAAKPAISPARIPTVDELEILPFFAVPDERYCMPAALIPIDRLRTMPDGAATQPVKSTIRLYRCDDGVAIGQFCLYLVKKGFPAVFFTLVDHDK